MVSQDYPIIPSPAPPQPPRPDEPRDDEFPRPEPDKDEQHLPVERLLGYVPKKKRTWLRVLLLTIAVIVVAGGGYFAFKHLHFAAKKAPAQSSSQKPTVSAPAPPTLKQYSSSNFNLSFSYPETWGIVDNGDGKLTITSPVMQLKSAAGKTGPARTVVTIQNKQTVLPDFKSGNAVAAIASQKITYTKPTSSQRAQTYISFLNYASSSASGIDGIYVTGDDGYQQGQAIPQGDVIQIDPLITVTFSQCADTTCASGGTALTLSAGDWTNSSFSGQILSILTSLAIQ